MVSIKCFAWHLFKLGSTVERLIISRSSIIDEPFSPCKWGKMLHKNINIIILIICSFLPASRNVAVGKCLFFCVASYLKKGSTRDWRWNERVHREHFASTIIHTASDKITVFAVHLRSTHTHFNVRTLYTWLNQKGCTTKLILMFNVITLLR